MDPDLDSAGVYFMSQDAFEARAPSTPTDAPACQETQHRFREGRCEICGQKEAEPRTEAADESETAQE